jgi:hypothetical protein
VSEEQKSHVVLPGVLLQTEAEGGVFRGRRLDAVDVTSGEVSVFHLQQGGDWCGG